MPEEITPNSPIYFGYFVKIGDVDFLLRRGGILCILLKILSMRSILLTLAYVVFYATMSAQGVFSNRTQAVLEKVIQDSARERYNWTRTVLETPGFGQAKTKFREIYEQISNSIIKTEGQKTFILTGQYEDPLEEKKCTHIVFSLLPGVGDVKKLKVELTLHKEARGWKVALSVYDDHEPRDGVEGAVTAN